MPERETFEDTVKNHIDKGDDVHAAFGLAIEADPEAYEDYLRRQRGTEPKENERIGE